MWQVEASFTKFVYPFLYPNRQEAFAAAALAVTGRTAPPVLQQEGLPLWVEHQFHDNELDNMLPYVRHYIRLPENQRRFILNPAILPLLNDIRTARMTDSQSGFRFSSIDLYLFFNGVAFLVLEVQPSSDAEANLSIAWIEDINADLASLNRGQHIWLNRAPGSMAESDATCLSHFLCGARTTLGEWIDDLLAPLCDASGALARCKPMVGSFLPVYGATLVRQRAEQSAVSGRDADVAFQQFASEHLMALRKTLPSTNRSRFAHELFDDPEHNYFPYHNVIHSQSLEGGFVLAYDNGASHFRGARSGAMQSFRTNYFYMMLLAMHQRMSILQYAMAAADAALVPERAALLRELRQHVYDFTARCYFSQASFSEERDQLYRRWQHAFHISQLYRELKEEVHDVDGFLEQVARERELESRERELRQEAHKTHVISYVSFILLPVTIVTGMIQASPILAGWLDFPHTPLRSSVILFLMLVAVSLLVGVVLRAIRRNW